MCEITGNSRRCKNILKIFVREGGTEVTASGCLHRRDAESAEEERKLCQQAETGFGG
jgi:hypothetical protein